MSDDTTTTTQPPPPRATTTAAPAPTSTTAALPPTTTTSAPPPTTTTASAPPPTSTTVAPPPTSTTVAPPPTTTAGSTTTAGPAITEATLHVDPDPGISQDPHSYQVASDAALKVTWTATNASGVNIDPVAQGLPASGEQAVPTQDGTLTLVALGDNGARSDPYTIDIHTHAPGDVVSPHLTVSSGVAAVLSHAASLGGQSIQKATVGDQITLEGTFSEATEAAKIGNQDASLSDPDNGSRSASVQVTLAADMTGDFEFQALKGGAVADTQSLHLDITPASTTTAAPGAQPTLDSFTVYEKDSDPSTASADIEAHPDDGGIVFQWHLTGDVASLSIDGDVGDVTDKTGAADGDQKRTGQVEFAFNADQSAAPVTFTLTITPTDSKFSAQTKTVQVRPCPPPHEVGFLGLNT